MDWGARASRRRHQRLEVVRGKVSGFDSCDSRRDADWSDRDGRGPHFQLNRRLIGLGLGVGQKTFYLVHDRGFIELREHLALRRFRHLLAQRGRN